MNDNSLFTKIINSIINFFKILITLVSAGITSLFNDKKNTEKNKKELQQELTKKDITPQKKKEQTTTDDITTLPDTDNIKTNPHQDYIKEKSDIFLEIPEKLYKVYTKDNELKYLNIKNLLDLLLKEDLEKMYKNEDFKLKTASTNELIKVDQIKERIYPKLIERAEKDILRNSEMIREELHISLIDDQLKNPLFPHRIEDIKKQIKEEAQVTKHTPTEQVIDNTPSQEIPQPSVTNNIKNITAIGATLASVATTELLTEDEPVKQKEISQEKTIIPQQQPEEEKEDIEIPPITEIELEEDKELTILQEELSKDEEKTRTELERLKEQVEEKIEEIKQEQKNKEEKNHKKEQVQEQLVQDSEIIDVELASDYCLKEAQTELKKEEFEDRDYDKIERQIDKMLNDITNTLLKYDKTLTPKQKAKLKKEEDKLRNAKDNLHLQKERDIIEERRILDQDILEAEKTGLQNELRRINEENNREVTPDLLRRMDNLEGMTREQVANMDKKLMLNRFRKANILLEMSSILALPFVRNKYFAAFTVGLIIDNHFNFVNSLFRRRINRYEPADLEQIKRGQDALNGALDITYKNIVELDALEQQALTKYPELAYDPRFVSQVASLRNNLTKKYNKLMRKNEVMEKYRLKTKKQIKKLKPKRGYRTEETR